MNERKSVDVDKKFRPVTLTKNFIFKLEETDRLTKRIFSRKKAFFEA